MKKLISLTICVLIALIISNTPMTISEAEIGLKKIPLKYSDHIPPKAGGNIFLKNEYFPKLQKQLAEVGYELDIAFYHAESLYRFTQQVQACEQGLIDMTVLVASYETSRFPMHEVLDLNFMGWNQDSILPIWDELEKSVPEFGNELTKNFVEFARFIPNRKLIHTNLGPDFRTPNDFKGKKIHCAGISSDTIKHIGAVPIRQDPSDWYTSLDRGLFEGVIVAFDMVGILKLGEVLNTHILPYHDSFGYTPVTHVISRSTFEKLPKEVQKLFQENFGWASEAISNGEKKNLEGYMKISKEKKNNFIELTPDETAQWRAAAEEVHKMWVEKINKKGLPGQKLYDEARRLSKKYTKE